MTGRGRIVHVRDKVPGQIYIGRRSNHDGLRGSPFANPFVIGVDGDRREVVTKYWQRLRQRRDLWRLLPTLRGAPLACWCRHDGEEQTGKNLCHGDVLLQFLDHYTDEELRTMAEMTYTQTGEAD